MDGALVLVGRCMRWCMVKGVWLSCMYTPVGIRKDMSKKKAFLVPGCRRGPWKLHIVCCHLTWIAAVLLVTQAELSQMGAKADMTLFLARMHYALLYKIDYTITLNELSVSSWHRPPPNHTLQPAVVPIGLSKITHSCTYSIWTYGAPFVPKWS